MGVIVAAVVDDDEEGINTSPDGAEEDVGDDGDGLGLYWAEDVKCTPPIDTGVCGG